MAASTTSGLFRAGATASGASVARAASPVPSDSGDADSDRPASQTRRAGGGKVPDTGGSRGVFIKDAKGVALRGRQPGAVDVRKYRYDVVRGIAAGLSFEVSKDDRMSAVDAGDMLEHIHDVCGVAKEAEGIVHAFDQALFLMHAVNGASVLGPGRGKFSVPGSTVEFSFATVRDVLGADARRFFRAYADDVVVVLKKVLRDYDPVDPVKAEQWGWVQQIAYDRGLQRFPYLIHDSADACLLLNAAERAAMNTSKAMVISTTNNSADRLRANTRVASAEGYDSTVGDRV